MNPASVDLARKEQLRTYDEQLYVIKKEIKAKNKKVKEIRFIRNALLPISKLSVEIYQEIFLILVLAAGENSDSDQKPYAHSIEDSEGEGEEVDDDDDDDDDDDESLESCSSEIEDPWDWIVITHVCRHWREVALGYPALWTSISPFWSQARLKAYLGRSKVSNLYVSRATFNQTNSNLPNFCDKIQKELYRIREFTLPFYLPFDDLKDITEILSLKPMRRLRRLQICSQQSISLLDYHRTQDSFLQDVHLSYLSLSRLSIPWDHHVLRGLLELSLTDIGFTDQSTISELLGILEGCPELESLVLIEAGPTSSEPNVNTHAPRPIRMLHLRKIHIKGLDFQLCEKVFSNLSIPSDSVLFIACRNYRFDNPEPFPVKQLTINHQAGRNKAKLTIDDEGISFSIYKVDPENYHTTLKQMWDYVMFREDYCLLLKVFRCMSAVLNQSFCGIITSIVIDLRGRNQNMNVLYYILKTFDHYAWNILLYQLRAIKELEIIFADTDEIVESFVKALTKGSDTQPPSFTCPNIETINLVGAQFGKYSEDVPGLYHSLLEHLALRRESGGKRLRKFSLIRCRGISKSQSRRAGEMNISDEIIWEPWLLY